MPRYPEEIEYSEKYSDGLYEYRHVTLPKAAAWIKIRYTSESQLLTEAEWRSLGVWGSRGWVHYVIHRPQPHILLFRRPLGTDPLTGITPTTVFKVHFSMKGNEVVNVKCTSFAGVEVCTSDFAANAQVSNMRAIIAGKRGCLPERLELIHTTGDVLKDDETRLLRDLLSDE